MNKKNYNTYDEFLRDGGEKKLQDKWSKEDLHKADDSSKLPKKYILDMFPYPSGAGLHVGHPESYTATDITARYDRMNGYNVLHPMGWDAFGLPAENYAIKQGVHPADSTAKNIKNFRRQIDSLGFSYDWSREVNTSSPEYYKWTQWFFLFLYKNDLAYKKKAKVNWCDDCQTVLANEQVVDGKCERCGHEVVQKDMEQWFFKITDYADDLIKDLDDLDWPESIKSMQRNWIGKSEGMEISFPIVISTERREWRNPASTHGIPRLHPAKRGFARDDSNSIKVFTTRPDTLFGATYMVLAPEHELVQKLKKDITNFTEVQKYIKTTAGKSDLQRTDLNKDKSGVELKGIKAINPANNEEVPVFIADYVLATYGTGAIMAVPAHDTRDFEFATKFDLKITEVITGGNIKEDAYIGVGKLVNSGEFNGMDSDEAKPKITKKVGGKLKIQYKLRDWLVSRQRYWGAPIPIVYDPEGNPHAVEEKHLPLTLPTDVDYKPKGTSPLGSSESYKKLAEKLYGKGWYFEIDTMDTFVCSSWYFFRYTDAQNKKEFASKAKMKQWLPVDLYIGGAEHAVLHLLYSRFFTKVLHDKKYIDFNEPFLKLRNQGMLLSEDGRKMSKSLDNVVNPDEVVENFGADSLRLYEMFMGQLEDTKPWQTRGIVGVRRFLEKVFALQQTVNSKQKTVNSALLHKTIKKVTDDIEGLKFNTAISAMMIFVNVVIKEKSITKKDFEIFLIILSPFAPHITEELWSSFAKATEDNVPSDDKHKKSIFLQPWPSYDKKLIKEENVTIAVQVNGKLRDTLEVEVDTSEAEVKKQALASEKVRGLTKDVKIAKVIYIKNRLINIVTD